MCYISIDNDNPNIINYYCRACGHIENTSTDLCILNTQYSNDNISNNAVVNEYTKLDPTLPHLYNINCINPDCICNNDNKIQSDILFIRYDEKNLKNIYLCTHCDTTWKSNEQ
jgi:aspartate carbamoyltransferase regulatory subunit